MKSFQYPLPKNGGFLDTFGARDFLEMLRFGRLKLDAQRRSFGAHKHGFADLLQIVPEVREVVLVPEPSQFFDGIGSR